MLNHLTNRARHRISRVAALLNRKRVDQLGFVVDDLDAAMAGWGALLPGESWRVFDIDAAKIRSASYRGGPASYVMRVALLGQSPQIELILPLRGPSIYHDWIDAHGYGLPHVGFFVTDVAATVAGFEQAGTPAVFTGYGARPDGTGAFAYVALDDEFPLFLELIEAQRPGHQTLRGVGAPAHIGKGATYDAVLGQPSSGEERHHHRRL